MSKGQLKKRIARADGETKKWGDGYRTFIAQDTVEEIIDEAKDSFPYKIHFDNNIGGKHYSFYPKNPKDPDKAFQVTDVTEISSKIAQWFIDNFCEKKRQICTCYIELTMLLLHIK